MPDRKPARRTAILLNVCAGRDLLESLERGVPGLERACHGARRAVANGAEVDLAQRDHFGNGPANKNLVCDIKRFQPS
jgi:hypothetical protein